MSFYAPKTVKAEDVTARIAGGDTLAFGYVHAGFEPFFNALAERCLGTDLRVIILSTLRYSNGHIFPLANVMEKLGAHVLICQLAPQFAGLAQRGKVDVLPLPFSAFPGCLAQEGRSRRLCLFCEVAPPDASGMCNPGYSAPFPPWLYRGCRVVGLLNESLPVTRGDSVLPADIFDCFVAPSMGTLPLFPEPEITGVLEKIGENVAQLVEDDSDIEIGVGSGPATVLKALSSKHGLCVHSGILPDGVRELVERGVVTRSCTANVTGASSPEFYRWLDRNPAVEIRALDYTHNVLTIAGFQRFVAINSALCIDLLGQAVCETVGPKQITGLGGALDYARGAALGGGRSIIMLPSSHGEQVSPSIVPAVEPGSTISLTRYDTDYVVTEYGIACLRYRTRQERVLALIGIAHPSHREWLHRSAAEMHLI